MNPSKKTPPSDRSPSESPSSDIRRVPSPDSARYFEVVLREGARWSAQARFRLFADAKRYVMSHRADGVFEVRNPGGEAVLRCEPLQEPAPEKTKKKRRKTAPTIPQMRRVRPEELDD